MKSTDTQKAVCNALIDQLEFWRDTNDIDSPTHTCDIDECYSRNLEECLSESELEKFRDMTYNLLGFVRELAV